jgi:predicted nucleic acid-binding protein
MRRRQTLVALRGQSSWATPRTSVEIATTCFQKPSVLFADTSALFAFLVRDDVHHVDAVRVESEVRSQREQVWTIDPVLTELWLLLRREIGAGRSDTLVAGVLERGVRRESLEDQDLARAWLLGREWVDQQFSLTDRQAFAALESTRRERAWSYDNDFAVIRLGPGRNRALEVVR